MDAGGAERVAPGLSQGQGRKVQSSHFMAAQSPPTPKLVSFGEIAPGYFRAQGSEDRHSHSEKQRKALGRGGSRIKDRLQIAALIPGKG